ncbi:MAG: hypothetical protein LBD58_05805 [Treponema sp.]|jgi:hypothetical protein|nr:hypothetical protein [Treponema sp.]
MSKYVLNFRHEGGDDIVANYDNKNALNKNKNLPVTQLVPLVGRSPITVYRYKKLLSKGSEGAIAQSDYEATPCSVNNITKAEKEENPCLSLLFNSLAVLFKRITHKRGKET